MLGIVTYAFYQNKRAIEAFFKIDIGFFLIVLGLKNHSDFNLHY